MKDFYTAYIESYQIVRRIIYRIVRDDCLADDLTQDAMLAAWINRERFKGGSKVSTWIVRIGLNCTFKYLAQRKKRREVEFVESEHTTINSCLDLFIADKLLETLQSNLSETMLNVIRLSTSEPLTYLQISKRLGVSRTSVWSALNYARELARKE